MAAEVDGHVPAVTFEENRGKTLLVMHELHSSKEALDAAGTGAADAMVETFAQLRGTPGVTSFRANPSNRALSRRTNLGSRLKL